MRISTRPRRGGRLVTLAAACLTAVAVTVTLAPPAATVPAAGPVPTAPANFGLPDGYQPTPEKYGVGYELGHVVPLADGTQIQAEVRYPTDPTTGQRADGEFPVVLNVTTYGALTSALTAALTGVIDQFQIPLPDQLRDVRRVINQATSAQDVLVRRGYIEVVADVRGTGGSTGAWNPASKQDGLDGAQLVDWAANLPGSNGKVGMYGYSFPALTALRTAQSVGPDSPLKAIVPMAMPNNIFNEVLGHDGMMSPILLTAISLLVPYLSLIGPFLTAVVSPQQFIPALVDHLQALVSSDSTIKLLIEAYAGGPLAYDTAWWQERRFETEMHNLVDKGIAMYQVGGFWDLYQEGPLRNYAQLQNLAAGRDQFAPMAPDQRADGRYQLLMGPWYHVGLGVGPGSRLDTNMITLAWFDRWLKDIPNGIDETETPLHVIDANNNAADTARYPFEQATIEQRWFDGDRLTARAPTVADASDRLDYTGIDNICNRQSLAQYTGGLLDFLFRVFNAYNPCTEWVQEPTAGLKYTTDPVTEATMLAGPASVTLYASSTGTDAAFQVWLDDVAPDGTVVNITGGSQLASQRTLNEDKTWRGPDGTIYAPEHVLTKETEQLLVPGEVTRMEIKLRPAFHRLEPGHALRLRITSGTFPSTIPIPTDLPRLLGTSQQIHRDAVRPSSLVLPLAPAGAFTH
ncbi:CocE/NonD family hydrolase [Nocardia otitidiscaviarum]|uniref:CocE/NonD family hydrolase n=1 Tax=Nocardia otitidiscaviarum TaxID=1823 RepID=UPI000A66ECA2|nr:CocE/NonD family hydrolase [Nocardia otitidiscaviarum]MBF6136574.1 CocE/NonD family hydrolase [Nocardia otitidiscaviarum]MBF6484776.1 CocE/NonD family hydrolase [Nocardia otitidiscaviarum]